MTELQYKGTLLRLVALEGNLEPQKKGKGHRWPTKEFEPLDLAAMYALTAIPAWGLVNVNGVQVSQNPKPQTQTQNPIMYETE